MVSAVADGRGTPADYLTLVCRSMQLVLIAILSLLPALLYYQFDRDRPSTLREKFVQQIFRLDSRLKTKGAIYAKYGPTIDEIYGAERAGRYRKLLAGPARADLRRDRADHDRVVVLLNPDVGVMRSGGSITAEEKIAQLFEPRHTAPAFAFLGAYFFTLFALFEGTSGVTCVRSRTATSASGSSQW